MFEDATNAELLDAMREAQRAGRVALAHELFAVGRFALARMAEMGNTHEDCCVDDWDVVASEVGAELGLSRGRASSLMNSGRILISEMPKLGEAFLAGDVDVRVLRLIEFRMGLVTDAAAIATIDDMVASRVRNWNALSDGRITALVDWMVLEVDPDAVRRAKSRDDGRHVEVRPAQDGMAEIWGLVRATDGAAFDEKLNQLADSVCADDRRTKRQRRADAVEALAMGDTAMACTCEADECPAAGQSSASAVVIHLVAEGATVQGQTSTPGFVPGYGAVPAATVRELARTAKLRPLTFPKDVAAEPQYRPSKALASFVRCRDLTCRWMNCDKPAWKADIDHTVPYPLGPTHPSNNVCYCRFHHLLKTFYCGPGGWNEVQLPDGTLIFTSPSGRIHRTKAFGSMLFPQLGQPTGKLQLPQSAPPGAYRGLAMPKRKRTRAQNRAHRIQRERNANAGANIEPPF